MKFKIGDRVTYHEKQVVVRKIDNCDDTCYVEDSKGGKFWCSCFDLEFVSSSDNWRDLIIESAYNLGIPDGSPVTLTDGRVGHTVGEYHRLDKTFSRTCSTIKEFEETFPGPRIWINLDEGEAGLTFIPMKSLDFIKDIAPSLDEDRSIDEYEEFIKNHLFPDSQYGVGLDQRILADIWKKY